MSLKSNFKLGSWLSSKKALISLILGLPVLFIFSLISVKEVFDIQKTKVLSDNLQKCQIELEEILFKINTAETFEYKFSVTGEDYYIKLFLEAQNEINVKVKKIQDLHLENFYSTERLKDLLANINNGFKSFNNINELKKSNRYDPAKDILLLDKDFEISEKISSLIQDEIIKQTASNEILKEEIVSGSKRTIILIYIIAIGGIFSLWFFIFSLHKEVKERKRTEEDLLFNERRLEMLFRISRFKSESVQELLDFTLNEAVTLTKSKLGYIYHYDEDKKVFILNTWSKDVMKECSVQNPSNIYPLEKTGIWGEAVRQRKPIIVNNFQAPNPLKKGYPEGHAHLYKFMTIPVFVNDRIVAVVGVANKETDYDQSDLRQLTLLMDSVWKIVEELELQVELRKWAKIFENSNQGILVLGGDCRTIEKMNPAFAKMNDSTVEKLINCQITDLLSTDSSEEFVKHLEYAVEKGHHTFEFRFIKKNNSEIPVNIDMTAVKDVHNRLSYIIIHIQDITDRVYVMEALKASEEKYRLIFENIPAGIFSRDLEGEFLSFNPFLVNLFECSTTEEFAEKYGRLTKRWSSPEKNAEFVDMLLKNKTISGYEVEMSITSGKNKWFSCSAYWDETDRVIKGFLIDITDQKRAERELKEKSNELDSFFNLSLDLLCIATIDGFFIKLNKEWETTLGYKINDLEGKRFLDFIHPDDMESTLSAINQLSENNPVLNFVNRYRCQDGLYKWIEWRSYPYQNKLVYAAARDITGRIKTEEELIELNSTKDKFFSIIAHDLKSPFTGLLGITEILADDKDLNEDERKEFISSLKELSHNTYKLLENLLHWSRIQTGRMEYIPSKQNLFFITQNIIKLKKEIAARKRIKIINRINPDSIVFADENMLQLIIRNLISNAIKFSFQDSCIDIVSQDLYDFIQVSVKDNGIGMSDKKIDNLFRIDKQSSTPGTAKETGTGLGLVLCKDMVVKQGGKIWAESEAGKGSTFHFTLPKVKE